MTKPSMQIPTNVVLCVLALALLPGCRIMLVGDSITNGSDGAYTWRYRLDQRWNSVIDRCSEPGAVIESCFEFVGPWDHIITFDGSSAQYPTNNWDRDHLSFGGNTLNYTKDVIQAEVAANDPHILVIYLGINDIGFRTGQLNRTPSQAATDLRTLIDNARAADPGVDFVLVKLPRAPLWATDVRVDAFNDKLDLIQTQKNDSDSWSLVRVVDSLVEAYDVDWDSNGDGLHPSAKGEHIIAKSIADGFKSLFNFGANYDYAYSPIGWIGDISASGVVTGWTCDRDVPAQSIGVHFYANGVYVAGGSANVNSGSAVNSECNGGSKHRFSVQLPASAKGKQIVAYGLNAPAGDSVGQNFALKGSPKLYD